MSTNKIGTLKSTTIAVSGLTTIGGSDFNGEINTLELNRIFVRIDNSDDTGTAAILFDQFVILGSPDGTNYETLYSSPTDYTSPVGILVGTSGDLTILAADATGWFILDCSALHKIKIQASADTTQSVGVTGLWSAI